MHSMADKQGYMFPLPDYIIQPRDPNVPEEAIARLSAQCKAILERMKEGPVTNTELSKMALKYTGRISDLRKYGCVIKHTHDKESGLVVYRLASYPEGLQ